MHSIKLEQVCKAYRLYGNRRDQLIEVLGLKRLGLKPRTESREFQALNDIDLTLEPGRRVGIIGRNGAGKTTLLKLVCGLLTPTSGRIEVRGEVQALLGTGLGFHPEQTGRENVASALQYNGLSSADYQAALADVIEFAELDGFIDQPFRTYSLGMQARLMFAAATSVKPEVLIVDEVLGAGDAYFAAKCKRRVQALVSSGCTLLLVSHSMSQVLEFCEHVLWLEHGTIKMQGDALAVVKAYEEYIHNVTRKNAEPDESMSEAGVPDVVAANDRPNLDIPVEVSDRALQEPCFLPHAEVPRLPTVTPEGFKFLTDDGLSRWEGETGVQVVGFTIVTERGESQTLTSLRPAKFVLTLRAEQERAFRCRYGIIFHDHQGEVRLRIFSPIDVFEIKEKAKRRVEILLNPCQLGPGEYIVGVSVHDDTPLEKINSSLRYDLLGRSFPITVELPDSRTPVSAAFFHSAEWCFQEADTGT